MAIEVTYRGMALEVSDQDPDNLRYYRFCAQGAFHLQRCDACSLLRFPPGPSCPWCGSDASHWSPVEPVGTVHSYTEVHHAIQPGFRPATPYAVLIVDLDEQRGRPTQEEALRVVGNLVDARGDLAPPEKVAKVGIGSRVRMVFTPLGSEIALPNWMLAEPAAGESAPKPWRFGDPKRSAG